MGNYKALQQQYLSIEIKENCVDIDFAYAFICAMANSELDLQHWMPLLFISEEKLFSSEKVASDFAQSVLAIYQQALTHFENNTPLILSFIESSSNAEHAIKNFANGYIQGLTLIDNLQLQPFPDGSFESNTQQTCLLLLDKLAAQDTKDMGKLAFFEQLPNCDEIITLLPSLLANYGNQCFLVNHS